MLERVNYEMLKKRASELSPYRGRPRDYWNWDSRGYGYKDYYISGKTNSGEPIFTIRYYGFDLVSMYPDNIAIFHKDDFSQGETTILSRLNEHEYHDDDRVMYLKFFQNRKRCGGFTYAKYGRNEPNRNPYYKTIESLLITKGIRYDVVNDKMLDKVELVYRKRDRKRSNEIQELLNQYNNQVKPWFSSMTYENFIEERDNLRGIYNKENFKDILARDPVKAFIVAGMKHSNDVRYYGSWRLEGSANIPYEVIRGMEIGMLEELHYTKNAMIEEVVDISKVDKLKTSNRQIEIRKEYTHHV